MKKYIQGPQCAPSALIGTRRGPPEKVSSTKHEKAGGIPGPTPMMFKRQKGKPNGNGAES